MEMIDEYIYPESLMELDRTTIYQEKDLITGEWSGNKTVGKMCVSTQNDFIRLIAGKRIRIVKHD